MNPRPIAATIARAAQRQERASTDLDEALAALRVALGRGKTLLETTEDPELLCRTGHMIAQVSGAVLRIVDAVCLDLRLSELEERFNTAKMGHGKQGTLRQIR